MSIRCTYFSHFSWYCFISFTMFCAPVFLPNTLILFFIFSFVFSFFSENCAVYEIMWKSTVEWGRLQMTIRRMLIACWIPIATNTHSEYVIPIAFPLQQWLHGRDSVLHLYSHCLSCYLIIMFFLIHCYTIHIYFKCHPTNTRFPALRILDMKS